MSVRRDAKKNMERVSEDMPERMSKDMREKCQREFDCHTFRRDARKNVRNYAK